MAQDKQITVGNDPNYPLIDWNRKLVWMVAVDGSLTSEHALQHALHLMDHSKDKLSVHHLYKCRDNDWLDVDRRKGKEIIQRCAQIVKKFTETQRRQRNVTIHCKLYNAGVYSSIDAEICERATRFAADYLVVGSRGLSLPKKVLLGSVSDYCVRNAPCPVIIIRHRDILPPFASTSVEHQNVQQPQPQQQQHGGSSSGGSTSISGGKGKTEEEMLKMHMEKLLEKKLKKLKRRVKMLEATKGSEPHHHQPQQHAEQQQSSGTTATATATATPAGSDKDKTSNV